MLLVAETVFVITTLSTTARRRQIVGEPYYTNTAALSHSFSVSSGISLGQKVTNEIEEINGVQSVSVKQAGGVKSFV